MIDTENDKMINDKVIDRSIDSMIEWTNDLDR